MAKRKKKLMPGAASEIWPPDESPEESIKEIVNHWQEGRLSADEAMYNICCIMQDIEKDMDRVLRKAALDHKGRP